MNKFLIAVMFGLILFGCSRTNTLSVGIIDGVDTFRYAPQEIVASKRIDQLPEKTSLPTLAWLNMWGNNAGGKLYKMTAQNLIDSVIVPNLDFVETDTTSLSNRIDLKLNSTDTASLSNRINTKQATLVSGTNIKTVNGNTLLGSGDITISGGSVGSSTSTHSEYWYVADEWGMVNDGVTDNTDSLQALIDYIGTTKKNSVIYFSKAGTYYFSSTLKDTLVGNAVIFFPTETITSVQYTITLKGYIRPTFSPSVYSATPLPSATILRIANIPKANGGGAFFGSHVVNPTVNFVIPGLEDIIIATDTNPQITAVDFSVFTCTFIKDVAIIAGNSQDALNSVEPTHNNSYGFKQPDNSHGINQRVEGVLNIFGFYYGAEIGEGALINDIGLWACKEGLVYKNAFGASEIGRAIIGWCPIGIKVRSSHNINIRQFSSEHYTLDSTKWISYEIDLIDSSSIGYGHIEWLITDPGLGGLSNNFTKYGGAAIFIHQLGKFPAAAGTNTQVQFNNSNLLTGDAGLVFNPTIGELTATSNVIGGSADSRSILAVNNNTSTSTSFSGNVAVYGFQDATTVGTQSAFLTYVINRGSGASIGTTGMVNGGFGTGTKIGILGRAISSSSLSVGGYFDLQATNIYTPPTPTQAALIANNANVSAPIFLGQDEGNTVFKIDDGGDITATRIGIGVAPSSWLFDVKGNGVQIDGNFYSNFRAVNATPDRGFYFGYDNTVPGSGIIAANSSYLGFWTFNGSAWGERVRITPTGTLSVNNASPAASSIMDLTSTTQGFLPPRMTAIQGSAIATPAEGLLIYVTDTNATFTSKGFWGYTGAAWEKLNN